MRARTKVQQPGLPTPKCAPLTTSRCSCIPPVPHAGSASRGVMGACAQMQRCLPAHEHHQLSPTQPAYPCSAVSKPGPSPQKPFPSHLPVVAVMAMRHLGKRTRFLRHHCMKASTAALSSAGVSPTGLAQSAAMSSCASARWHHDEVGTGSALGFRSGRQQRPRAVFATGNGISGMG